MKHPSWFSFGRRWACWARKASRSWWTDCSSAKRRIGSIPALLDKHALSQDSCSAASQTVYSTAHI